MNPSTPTGPASRYGYKTTENSGLAKKMSAFRPNNARAAFWRGGSGFSAQRDLGMGRVTRVSEQCLSGIRRRASVGRHAQQCGGSAIAYRTTGWEQNADPKSFLLSPMSTKPGRTAR